MSTRSVIVPLNTGGHLRIDQTKKLIKISPSPSAEDWAYANLSGKPSMRPNGDSPDYPSWRYDKPINY